MFEDWVPAEDAPIVERLQAAGAVLVGKTATSELAHSSFTRSPLWGVTRNPWNRSRTAGGSSGGSAAAVAARMVPLAEGSDAGGSVRIPASCCGVVGFKPSAGRVPVHAFASDFEPIFHFGPLSRTVADACLMFDVMQGPDDRDPLSVVPALDRLGEWQQSVDVTKLRIALSVDLGYYEVDTAVADNTVRAAAAFRELGAEVTTVDLGWDRSINDAWALNWSVLLATLFGDIEAAHRDRVDPELVKLIEEGRHHSAIELKHVDIVRSKQWAKLRDILRSHDLLVCPTVALPVPPAEGLEDSDFESDSPDGKFRGFEMTSPFSLVPQCPVISVPSGVSPDGMPTGMQLVGRRFADAELLYAAAAYERTHPWYDSLSLPP
jgi:amidase/aspartyl-tRNA(Asn)/glutamyl-tRNA(Gln) amidotransferase subunit A